MHSCLFCIVFKVIKDHEEPHRYSYKDHNNPYNMHC